MSYLNKANASRWVKITKTYADFAAAALTNSITVYTLPAKYVIQATQMIVTQTFSGGLVATYTVSAGIGGALTKYRGPTNVFTGATLPVPVANLGMESDSAGTSILATAISTVANLDQATQGSVDIYFLISKLP